ncbi:MAG: hypothetical protein JWM19_1680 [Actinomycetia bacterium]|nr:hypothetical protein [Actinomycetes bacterium]
MKDVKGPGDFLAWLGGADLKIVAQAPDYERTRFIQMAIVLLTTSGIGTLSMMFALHDGVRTSLAVAIIGGLAWGFIILNLDRFLVLSMGHTRDWKRLVLMALPRLALAAVISMVVATPMTLRIFATDIKNEMVQVNANESAQVAKQQQQTGPATQAAAILTKITTDKQVLAGHLEGTVSNPEVAFWQGKVNTLTPQVQQAQTAMDTAQAAYQCEVDGSGAGCEGASNLQGQGPMAKLKKTELGQAQQKYQTLNTQLQSAQQQLAAAQSAAEKASGQTLQQQQSAAKTELPGLQQQYNQLEAQLKRNEAQAQGAVEDNTGILAQLQDLSTAGAKNPMLSVAQWVVTLLFFCIEILPVTVKVLLNIGPLSTYETLLKNEEDMITDEAKLTRVTRRRDAERAADKQIAIDEHMRQLEEDLGKKANTHVAQHMSAILDVALAEWSSQVQATLGVQVMPGTLPGAAGTVSGQALPGTLGGYGSPGTPIHVTGPQPRLSLTGPQPAVGASGSGGNGANGSGANGSGANGYKSNGQVPTITYLTPPDSGYALPDDEDGDLL